MPYKAMIFGSSLKFGDQLPLIKTGRTKSGWLHFSFWVQGSIFFQTRGIFQCQSMFVFVGVYFLNNSWLTVYAPQNQPAIAAPVAWCQKKSPYIMQDGENEKSLVRG